MRAPAAHQHRRAARWVAGFGVFVWAGVFFGLVDLVVVIDRTPGFYEVYLLETGWGLLYTVLVSLPLVAVAVRPGAFVTLAQVALVGVAVGVTALLSLQIGQLVPAVMLLLNAAFCGDLAWGSLRSPVGRRIPRFDPWLLGASGLAAPVCGYFAWKSLTTFRSGEGPTDITLGLDHWPTQAALYVAIVLVAVLVCAALPSRWPGGLVAAVSVATAAAWLGATSVAYPEHSGSLGGVIGLAAVAWGLSFLGLALVRRFA